MSAAALRSAVTGAPASATKDGEATIFSYLKVHTAQIEAALPKHMLPERMVRVVTTEIRRVPKLLECSAASLFGAIIQAAQLGLEPGNGLGHAYLVPYRDNKKGTTECQLIIGYRGMIDLARRSGQLVSLMGAAVYANDLFDYELGLNEQLRHKPSREANRGELIYAYAIAKLKDGGVQFVVMSKAEIDGIRKRSKASDSGPWVTDFEAMAIKTTIRRLFKYLPVSIELQRAVVLDEAADRGEQDNAGVIDGTFRNTTDDEPTALADTSAETPKVPTEPIKAETPVTVTVNTTTGEVSGGAGGANTTTPGTGGGAGIDVTYAYVAAKIASAADVDTLNDVRDLIKSVADHGQRAELVALARDREAAIGKGALP